MLKAPLLEETFVSLVLVKEVVEESSYEKPGNLIENIVPDVGRPMRKLQSMPFGLINLGAVYCQVDKELGLILKAFQGRP